MKLENLKKLSEEELNERFPFMVSHSSNELSTLNYFYNWGWRDLQLCWAEKVRLIYEFWDEDTKNDFYITEVKEKYGQLRIYTSFHNEDVDKWTRQAEYLSNFVCIKCGKITSNKKGLITYIERGSYSLPFCKKCAKEKLYEDIKDYGINDKELKKWLHSNPHYGLYRHLFDKNWARITDDWNTKWKVFREDAIEYHKEDSKQLLELED